MVTVVLDIPHLNSLIISKYIHFNRTCPQRLLSHCFNPDLTNGFSHRSHLGESTFIVRGVRSDFFFYIIFR